MIRKLCAVVAVAVAATWASPVAVGVDKPATMLIIDASGSMANNDAGGKTRMEAAKDAGNRFVDEAGELGLVTYGSKVGSDPALKDKGCADIDVVSKPAKGNAAKMKAEIDKLQPSGYTPIGNSLRKAAEQFGEKPGTVILVSDGIDTCAPPPACEVAKELKAKGVDLVINTIGFNVDEAARSELQCIADVAGGKYADVRDAGSLSTALKEANTRTADRYSSSVPALQGASDAARATAVDFKGSDEILFRADIAHGDTYWKLPVAEGDRYVVGGVTLPSYKPSDLYADYISIRAGFTDATGTENLRFNDDQLFNDRLSRGFEGFGAFSESFDSSKHGDAMLLHFERNDTAPDKTVPVEIKLKRVPPVDNIPAAVTAAKAVPPALTGAAKEITTPGKWFDSAVQLDPKKPVKANIVAYEEQLYKIHLEEGQTLNGMLRVDDFDRHNLEDAGDALRMRIYTPDRLLVDNDHGVIFGPKKGDQEALKSPVPVSYSNGFPDTTLGKHWEDAAMWRPGDYYISIQYGTYAQEQHFEKGAKLKPVSYTFAADVVGQPQPGPQYSSQKPDTASSVSADSAPDSAAKSENSVLGKVLPFVLVGGVVVLLLLVLVVVFALRRK